MGLQRTTGPAIEPLSTAQAKLHLRLDSDQTEEDGLVAAYVGACRAHLEDRTRRAWMTQTWTWTLDRFPCDARDWQRGSHVPWTFTDRPLELPRPPLQSVTSLRYIDLGGTQQTLDPSAYTVDTTSEPGRIVPAYGTTWPSTRDVPNAVEVVFVAGYAEADQVPLPLLQALRLLVGQWFEEREAVITGTIATELPNGVRSLISPYVVPMFA